MKANKIIIFISLVFIFNNILSTSEKKVKEEKESSKEEDIPIETQDEKKINESFHFNPLGTFFLIFKDQIATENYVYENPKDNSLWSSDFSKTHFAKIPNYMHNSILANTKLINGLPPFRLKLLKINSTHLDLNYEQLAQLHIENPKELAHLILQQNLDNSDIWILNLRWKDLQKAKPPFAQAFNKIFNLRHQIDG